MAHRDRTREAPAEAPPEEEQETPTPVAEHHPHAADLARKVAQLEREKAELVIRLHDLEELTDKAKALRVGEHVVLAEDGEFETVLLHRKRSARPTGRYVPKYNYRFAVPDEDEESLATLKEQGAVIVDGAAGTKVVSLTPNVRPLKDDERPPSFTLPEDVAKHALAAGAIEEELQ